MHTPAGMSTEKPWFHSVFQKIFRSVTNDGSSGWSPPSHLSRRAIRDAQIGTGKDLCPSISVFPRQCNCSQSPYSYSLKCCSNQKDKRKQPGNLRLEIGDHLIENKFYASENVKVKLSVSASTNQKAHVSSSTNINPSVVLGGSLFIQMVRRHL
jgi:hypothetical protein